MCKWWWKLEHDTGPWQDFMWKKYLPNSCVFSDKHKAHDSALWTNMLKVRDIYLSGRSMKANNGERTHFWGHAWCGSTPLKYKYPLLYNLCNEIDITVADAARRNWFFTYRRWLSAELLVQDGEMRDKLNRIVLTQGNDSLVWDWTKNGQFTVKSVYKNLSRAGIDRSFKHLWKAKIPLKIKVWLWLIWHNAIATKDTMLERGWTGNPFCQFCRQKETILHLFFSCPAAKYVWSCVAKSIGAVTRPGNFSQFFWWFPRHIPASRNVQILGVAAICWTIWKLRNRACFEGKLIKSPIELILYATVFMNYWAGLNSVADQENIRRGAGNLVNVAESMHNEGRRSNLRIEDGGANQSSNNAADGVV
jgi:hypothetical protein